MTNRPFVSPEDVEHRFGYHRATFPLHLEGAQRAGVPLHEMVGQLDADGNEATAPKHAFVRKEFMDVAEELLGVVPPGREQALMLTALQEAAMWANAAIAMDAPLVRE